MENNDSNLKPQSTGGLKLMTVFVVVLALHVVVIGSMTAYYMLGGGHTDADPLADRAHKGLKANADGTLVADAQAPDSDKTPTPSQDATTPAPAPTTAPDQTPAPDSSSTASTTTTATPAPAPTTPDVATPAPAPVTTASTPAPTPDNTLTPPAEPAPKVMTPVIAPTGPVAMQTPANGGNQYTVKSHDSLAKIAHSNHITVANLMAANSMTSDKLSIGQKLTIPAKAQELGTTEATGPADASTATPAPTPSTDATPVHTPAVKTPAAKPAKTVVAKVSPKSPIEPHSYTVVKGDTLVKIAHKFKTTPTALMAANGISDPTKLSIGKKLTIPSREAHTAKISTPAAVQPATAEPKVKASTVVATNNIQ